MNSNGRIPTPTMPTYLLYKLSLCWCTQRKCAQSSEGIYETEDSTCREEMQLKDQRTQKRIEKPKLLTPGSPPIAAQRYGSTATVKIDN